MLSTSDSAVPAIQIPPPNDPLQTLRLPRALQLWHLTSLDAATVATVWTWLIARSVHAHILLAELAAMFLAVWMIYAIDRLLDAASARKRSFPENSPLQPRHAFHLRHRQTLIALLALALIFLGLVLNHFPRPELMLDLALFAALAAWFLLIHFVAPTLRLPKELAVGVFFPAAVFLPALVQGSAARAGLILPAILFGLLCAINALFIHRWEELTYNPPVATSEGDALTCWLLLHLRTLAIFTCLGGLAAALLLRGPALFLCLAASLALAGLLALDRWQARFEATDLRALADLVLLSPLLLSPLLHAPWLR